MTNKNPKPRQYKQGKQKWLPLYDDWYDGWVPVHKKERIKKEE